MKVKLILGGLLAVSSLAEAQTWAGSGITTGNAYRTGNVGIGTTSPFEKLSVATAVTNDGISVTQTSGGASALHLYNSSAGGNHWALFSTGNGNTQGSGNFSIFQYGATDRLFIKGSNGHVGIGTVLPAYKLHVEVDDAGMTNNPMYINGFPEPTWSGNYTKLTTTTKLGVHTALHGYDLNNTPSVSGPSGIPLAMGTGVFGKSERTIAKGNSQGAGVWGISSGSFFNWGGVFMGDVGIETAGKQMVGENDETGVDFGIWSSSGKKGTAAYFNGKTYANEYFQAADTRFQNEVIPLKNAIQKLSLLQSVSFTFKTNEYKALHLPEGNQIGLSSKSVQENFPELVQEFSDVSPILLNVSDRKVESYKSINYINLIPLLIAGIQEQQTQIQDQAKSNEELKNLLAMQQQQMEDLLAKSSLATGVSTSNDETNNFNMEQNIPNPFSNETVIRYNLPETAGKAKLMVYDLSGKQIASFPLNQKGSASITLNSDKLSAGIYIYSIIVDGKVMDSKRMVVAEKE